MRGDIETKPPTVGIPHGRPFHYLYDADFGWGCLINSEIGPCPESAQDLMASAICGPGCSYHYDRLPGGPNVIIFAICQRTQVVRIVAVIFPNPTPEACNQLLRWSALSADDLATVAQENDTTEPDRFSLINPARGT